MTGPEHYREAERLLAESDGVEHPVYAVDMQRRAQVHATLALAAATATGMTYRLRPSHPTWSEWHQALGTKAGAP